MDDPDHLTLEKMRRAIGRFEAEMRWMHGRQVVALKVGRRTYTERRDAILAKEFEEGRPRGPLTPLLEGIPVYVVDATDHLEKIYADEDLAARLRDAPAALP